MKNIFRIAINDTVKANIATLDGNLLATLYDSGFTTIKQVENNLIHKVPHYGGKKLVVSIFNTTKDTYKSYTTNVNR